MAITSARADSPTSQPRRTSDLGPDWALQRAQPADVAAVKVLFRRLHAFNAALDARFALSDRWETPFEAAMQRAVHSADSICLLARERRTDLPCGFVLAAVHRDSDLWQYREWVEIEALYVDAPWHGGGLAASLLGQVYTWAEGIGQPVVQLYVTASNERAIRFYQHAGFHTTQEIMRKVLV